MDLAQGRALMLRCPVCEDDRCFLVSVDPGQLRPPHAGSLPIVFMCAGTGQHRFTLTLVCNGSGTCMVLTTDGGSHAHPWESGVLTTITPDGQNGAATRPKARAVGDLT